MSIRSLRNGSAFLLLLMFAACSGEEADPDSTSDDTSPGLIDFGSDTGGDAPLSDPDTDAATDAVEVDTDTVEQDIDSTEETDGGGDEVDSDTAEESGTCAAPIQVSLPFSEEYTTGGGEGAFDRGVCEDTDTAGSEVIYELQASAGDRFILSLDTEAEETVFLAASTDCDSETACLVGAKDGDEVILVADSDGSYFVIVESDGTDVPFTLEVRELDPCAGETCSGHGLCVDESGAGACQCLDEGYSRGIDPLTCVAPQLRATSGGTALVHDVTTLDLGSVGADGTGAESGTPVVVQIANDGEPDLAVTIVGPIGAQGVHFQLDPSAYSTPIDGGDITEFSVYFDPRVEGELSTVFTLQSNDPELEELTFFVTGNGLDVTSPVAGAEGLLSLSLVSSDEVKISWAAASDNYSNPSALMYRAVFSDSDNIGEVPGMRDNGTLIQDWAEDIQNASTDGFQQGQTYWFNVAVRDEAGNMGAYATDSIAIPDVAPPTPGTGLVVAESNSLSLNLTWGAASDNVSESEDLEYRVVGSDAPDISTLGGAATNGSLLMDWTQGASSIQIDGLRPGNLLYLAVVVRDKAGNMAIYPMINHRLPAAENCWALLEGDLSTGNGVYTVNPTGGAPLSVYCDMEDGGWTLVVSVSGSSREHTEPGAVNVDSLLGRGFGKLSDEVINQLLHAWNRELRWDVPEVGSLRWSAPECEWSANADACNSCSRNSPCGYAHRPLGLYATTTTHTISYASGGCGGDPAPYTGIRDWHGNECDRAEANDGLLWVR